MNPAHLVLICIGVESIMNGEHAMKKLAMVFMLALCSVVQAGEVGTQVITTPLDYQVEHAKGAELTPRVKELVQLTRAGKLDEAEAGAKALAAQYQALFDKSLKQYVFQSKVEYEEFKAAATDPFEWIDWGYLECFQMQAFIRSERQDFQGALKLLEWNRQLAPISAGTADEKGFVLNQLKRHDEALDAYTSAERLALKYASQRPHLAIALRGKGFALIELDHLDEAEAAFKSSLEVAPNNPLALNELNYIQRLRGAK